MSKEKQPNSTEASASPSPDRPAPGKRARRRYVVAPAADLPSGSHKVVAVNGREIGIFNLEGNYYALLNRCPHRGAPLCQGVIRPLVTSDGVYQVSYDEERQVLKCPWHMWEFDIESGQALFDPKMRVRTYSLQREGDDLALYI